MLSLPETTRKLKAFGVSCRYHQLADLCRSDAIPCKKVGNHWKIDPADLPAIAEQLGVHRNTVVSDMCTEKSVYTPKPVQPRKVTRYEISHHTTPEKAAAKIRERFGDEFIAELVDEALKQMGAAA